MNCDRRCDFTGNYELSRLPALKAVERRVLGGDYGGTSWTTVRQASHIIASLELGPTTRLLEAGCGSGWPGLYVSRVSGCAVTLLDLPLNALRLARERAVQDAMDDRVHVVSGSATALPFGAAVFDCVSHSDVLCCLPGKREMLAECRRVTVAGGRMHFSVIAPASGLDERAHASACAVGPPFVDVDISYRDVLAETGWRVIERINVTEHYLSSLGRLVESFEADAETLAPIFDDGAFADVVAHRKDQVRAVEDGLLVRRVFVATAD